MQIDVKRRGKGRHGKSGAHVIGKLDEKFLGKATPQWKGELGWIFFKTPGDLA